MKKQLKIDKKDDILQGFLSYAQNSFFAAGSIFPNAGAVYACLRMLGFMRLFRPFCVLLEGPVPKK